MTNRNDTQCSSAGCGAPHWSRGYCNRHYRQAKKLGIITTLTPEGRFWAKVEKTDACWNWAGGLFRDGYAAHCVNRRKVLSHRYSFELHNGPIPNGMQVDHTCHNRRCVRPEHLRLATMKQNSENLTGARRHSKSGVRGVYWVAKRNRWRATVGHNYKIITVGEYRTLEEASEAARLKRLELFTHNDADRGLIPCR